MIHFTPDPFLTIDEQLLPSQYRCPFLGYIPSKPDKLGIKFWLWVDNKSKYCYNQDVHLGSCKHSLRGKERVGEFVDKLSEPIIKKGYYITTDNYFTSLNLAKYLLQNNTTLVGTVQKSAKFLMNEYREKKNINESSFFQEKASGCLLVSY